MMQKRPLNKLRPRRDSGFSLIEVLVAMLILAIGLLGLAALQAQGLRFNHDAYVRTQATHLAYDIIDRMRANPDNFTVGLAGPNQPDGIIDNIAQYTAGVAGPPFNCVVDGTVAAELECWHKSLADTLPAGSGAITASATANYVDVTVRWLDRTPRDFGGTVKAPTTAAECALVAGNFWDGTSCLVQQTWTVWP